MSAAAARLPEPRHLAGACLAVLAIAIGGLAGLDPKFAIAAAFGLAFVVVAIANLAVGVTIFGLLTFLELAPVAGGPVVSFAKLAGLTLAISWLAATASDPRSDRLIFSRHAGLMAIVALFISWAALSALWAESLDEATSSIGRYALNAVLFPIVYTAIREPKHIRWVAASLVAGAAVAAAYGLVTIPSASEAADSITAATDLNRITGTIGDPNLLASVLIVGMIMAIALSFDRDRAGAVRLLCAGVAALCFLAVVWTVSRGGIIALGAALIATVVFAGERRGRALVAALVFAVLALGYFTTFATDAQVERLETADGGSGRTDIWKVGWRMVEANPGHGVGAGNFNVSSVHYLLVEPGAIERSGFIVDTPAVAHNVYLEILAELGIPGLTLFLLLIGISTATALRAARMFRRLGEEDLELIARAVVVSLCSTFAADFFLAAEFSKLLWLLLSLGPAMVGVATALERRCEESGGAAAIRP